MTVFNRYKPSPRWIWIPCMIAGLSWFLLPTQSLAATGTIADNADVLNTTTVEQTTAQFSYTVDIFTTNTFAGSDDTFDSQIEGLTSSYDLTDSSCDPVKDVGCELYTQSGGSTYSSSYRQGDPSTSVEIGINVATRHIAIDAGRSVKIDSDLYSKAVTTFATTMKQTHDDYTQATIAALNTLQNSSSRFWSGIGSAFPFIIIGIVVIIGIASSMLFGNSGSGYRRRYYGGGGGGWGGGGNSGGGGGGGASGNF